MASACAKSSLSFRKARSENSPGRAKRAPSSKQRLSNISSTTLPPCPCSSNTSSPVKECGAGKYKAMPSSRVLPSAALKRLCVALRGVGRLPSMSWAIVAACAPESRIMPTPPRPGGVATATIVSGLIHIT